MIRPARPSRWSRSAITTTLVLAALGVSRGAAQAQIEKDLTPPPPPAEDVPIPQTGFISINEDYWLSTLADEPRENLSEAQTALLEGHPKNASRKIHKAAAHVRMAASREEGSLRTGLIESAASLDSLADRMLLGALGDEELAPVFAEAVQRLALHHMIKADGYWRSGDGTKAGHDLREAVEDTRQAALWYHRTLAEGQAALLTITEGEAETLVQGTPVDRLALLQHMGEVHELIRNLGPGTDHIKLK